jgi:hypothetical protein
VRLAAILNPNANEEHAKKALKDDFYMVRNVAKHKLNLKNE